MIEFEKLQDDFDSLLEAIMNRLGLVTNPAMALPPVLSSQSSSEQAPPNASTDALQNIVGTATSETYAVTKPVENEMRVKTSAAIKAAHDEAWSDAVTRTELTEFRAEVRHIKDTDL